MKKFLLLLFAFLITFTSYAQNNNESKADSTEELEKQIHMIDNCFSLPLYIDYKQKSTQNTTENNDEYVSFEIKKYGMASNEKIFSPRHLVLSHLKTNHHFRLYFSKKYSQFVLMVGDKYYFLGGTKPAMFDENIYLRLMPVRKDKILSFFANPNNIEKSAFFTIYDCNLQKKDYVKDLSQRMSHYCMYYRLKTNFQQTKEDYRGFTLIPDNANQQSPDAHLERTYNINLGWNNDAYQFILSIDGKKTLFYENEPIFFQNNMFLLLRKDTDIYSDDLKATPNNLEKSYFMFLGDCSGTKKINEPIIINEQGVIEGEQIENKYPVRN